MKHLNTIIKYSAAILLFIYSTLPAGAQTLDPPENLTVEVFGTNVYLSWNAPGSTGQLEELVYDNNVATGSYKYPGFTMSTRMSPAEPCQIMSLRYYTTSDGSDNGFNAKIFNWNVSQPGLTVLYSSQEAAANGEWVEVDVSGENINVYGDFVVGFGSFSGQAYLGYDANLNNGRSWDLSESQQIWTTWNETYLIRATVQYASGKVEELRPIEETKNQIINPEVRASGQVPGRQASPLSNQARKFMGLLGYRVYRDGEQISSDLVTERFYNDAVPDTGTYSYAVAAVYDEGLSDLTDPVEATVTTVLLPNPTNLGGQLAGDKVNLYWVSPGGGTEEELVYDHGEITGSYKYPGVSMSTHMTPSADCQVIKLKYYTTLEGPDSLFYARVFGWEGNEPGNYMYLNRSEKVANDAWVELDVEDNNLYFSGDFVVGFGSVSEDAYLGYDDGYDNGRSWDRTESSQTWATWTETYMIRAVVRYGDGKLEELGIRAGKGFQGYNLFRNGDKLNDELVLATSYTDTLPGYGDYDYNVSAVYDEGESPWSNTTSFSYHIGVDELLLSNIKVYPNPASDHLVVHSKMPMTSLRLIALTGNTVFEDHPVTKEYTLRPGKLPGGIYFLEITTSSGRALLKVMFK